MTMTWRNCINLICHSRSHMLTNSHTMSNVLSKHCNSLLLMEKPFKLSSKQQTLMVNLHLEKNKLLWWFQLQAILQQFPFQKALITLFTKQKIGMTLESFQDVNIMRGLTKRIFHALLVTQEQKAGVYKLLNASLACKSTSLTLKMIIRKLYMNKCAQEISNQFSCSFLFQSYLS